MRYREAQGVSIATSLELNILQDQRLALESEILKRVDIRIERRWGFILTVSFRRFFLPDKNCGGWLTTCQKIDTFAVESQGVKILTPVQLNLKG